MSNPTTSIRWAAAQTIVTALRASSDLTGVEVAYGFVPRQGRTRQFVFIGDIDGDVSIPVFGGPQRMRREDLFRIPIGVHVAIGKNADDTAQRLMAIMAVVENLLADHADLSGLSGVVDAQIINMAASVASIDATGHQGFGDITIQVRSRLD